MMCSITHIYMKDRLEDYNEGNKDRTVPSPFLPYVLLTKKKKKRQNLGSGIMATLDFETFLKKIYVYIYIYIFGLKN